VSHLPGPVNETKISLGMVTVTPPNELIVLVQYLYLCRNILESASLMEKAFKGPYKVAQPAL